MIHLSPLSVHSCAAWSLSRVAASWPATRPTVSAGTAPLSTLQTTNRWSQPTVELVILVIGLIAIGVLYYARVRWYEQNKDAPPAPLVQVRDLLPPDDLSPALVPKLLGRSGGGEAVLAAALTLANQGYIRFRQMRFKQSGGVKNAEAWRLSPRTGETSHYAARASLRPLEAAVLEALFGDLDHVRLRDRVRFLGKITSQIGKWSVRSLLDAGYLDTRILLSCRRGMKVGFGAFLVGLLGLLAVGIWSRYHGPWLFLCCLALIGVGLSWLRGARRIHGLTARGNRAKAGWLSFQKQLRGLTPAGAEEGKLASLLPHAAALGVVEAVNRAYAGRQELLPDWYEPSPFAASTNPPVPGSALTMATHGEDYGVLLATVATILTGFGTLGEAAGAAGVGADGQAAPKVSEPH